jgi:hypothetical protein
MSAYSVCIPRIFSNIPNKKIVATFENLGLGKVDKLDIIWKTGRDGSSFKMAFVHFSEWNIYNSAAMNFREQVENPNMEAKLVYDDPWYWIVLPNNVNAAQNTTVRNHQKSRCIRHVQNDDKQKLYKEVFSNATGWITDRILHLEEELTCIYEELYQREFIPAKYRNVWDLETDIETGNSNAPVYENMSPMTMDELDGGNNDDDLFETYDHAKQDALHCPPSNAKIHPYNEQDDIDYYTNEINNHTKPSNICFQESIDYDYRQPIQNMDDIAITINQDINNKHDKLWMTMNCCGND